MFVEKRARRPAESGRAAGVSEQGPVGGRIGNDDGGNETRPAAPRSEPAMRPAVSGQSRQAETRGSAPQAANAEAVGGEPGGSFRTLGLSAETLAAVERAGYTVPTPVQAGTIARQLAPRRI